MDINVIINSFSEDTLKTIFILKNSSYVTESTVNKIIDRFPTFFDNVCLYIGNKDSYIDPMFVIHPKWERI